MEQRWSTLDQIARARVIAQVQSCTHGAALELATAFVDGGIRVLEVMFTTPKAHNIVEELKNAYGELVLVGAGGLTSSDQVSRASANGAEFLSSPGCDADLISIMQQTNLIVIPGVFTPSEIMLAEFMGTDAVILFPGCVLGAYHLQILRKTFPKTLMFASEEVSIDNVKSWFLVGATTVTVAGDVLAPADMQEDDRSAVVAGARKLVEVANAQ